MVENTKLSASPPNPTAAVSSGCKVIFDSGIMLTKWGENANDWQQAKNTPVILTLCGPC